MGKLTNYLPLLAGILAALPAPASTENVFVGDHRAQVTNSHAPWSAIGKLILPDDNFCTASLVGADLIITAAHCLFDDRTGEFSGGTYRFFSAYVTRFWWGTRDPDHERGQDWAIGRLDRPLGNSRGWLGIKELDLSQDLMDPKYYMGAFEPDFDRAKVMAWEGGCQFTAMHEADSTVLHNCDGTRGSSGAPIFYYEDVQNPGTSNYMVALQVGEYRDGGEASLIGIPYTDAHANVAVPVSAFHWKLTELKAAAP